MSPAATGANVDGIMNDRPKTAMYRPHISAGAKLAAGVWPVGMISISPMVPMKTVTTMIQKRRGKLWYVLLILANVLHPFTGWLHGASEEF